MKLVFLGAPGAGKGTQAERLARVYDVAHISTGDMLRRAVAKGTGIGNEVKAIMDSGQLVPDKMIVQLIQERVKEEDCKNGYILDGFPRTEAQAATLDSMLKAEGTSLSAALLFEVDTEELKKRLASRRGSETRSDDTEAVQIERLKVYEKQTKPLIDFYERAGLLKRVNASGTIEEIGQRVAEVLKGA
jgi:adenylate kinase